MFESFWRLLTKYVLSPRAESAEVEERVRRAKAKLPPPVIWLLGKTQAGKTSIIRAITGSTEAEIGNGFRPCTRTARLYSFPSEGDCLLRFLDTRGLGESNYDPADDIAYCQGQAHILMVVARAMDHAQNRVHEALSTIRRAKPKWPVIVAQTALHDGYDGRTAHSDPYPFETEPWSEIVPIDLARSLKYQRQEFAGLGNRFVAVDFTLPDDGLLPEFYGKEALGSAIEAALPLGLRDMLEQQQEFQAGLDDLYYRTAWPHVVAYSVAAGAAGAVPLPVFNFSAVVAIDAQLFRVIASIYEQPLTMQLMGELSSALGTGFLLRLGGRSLLVLIPGIGSAAASIYSAAMTYALGRTLCWYFSQTGKGIIPQAEDIRKFFAQVFEEGRRRFTEFFKSKKRTPSPTDPPPEEK